MEHCFLIDARMAAGDAHPSLYIFDSIGKQVDGGGFTSKDVGLFLAANRNAKEVWVHINSAGGDASDAVAIFNSLVAFPGIVTTVVDSLAASAAALIWTAGKMRLVSPGSRIFLHRAFTKGVEGNADRQRDVARHLDGLDKSVAAMMAKQCGLDVDKVYALMCKDTWMTAEEALAHGFANGAIDSNPQMRATVDLSGLSNVPADLKWQDATRLEDLFRIAT